MLVYTSLGVLFGLIFVGIVWDIFMRKKAQVQEDVVLGMNLTYKIILSKLLK